MGFLDKRRTRERTAPVRIPVGIDTSTAGWRWLPLIDLAVVASMSRFDISGAESTTLRGRQNAIAAFILETAGNRSGQTRIFIDLGVTKAQSWTVSAGTLLKSGERALDFEIRGQLRRTSEGLYEQEIATVNALTRDGRLENAKLHDILREALEQAMASSPDFAQLDRLSDAGVREAIAVDLDESWRRLHRPPVSATIETEEELGEARARLDQMMPEARVGPGTWLFGAPGTTRTAQGTLQYTDAAIRVSTASVGEEPLTSWRDLVPMSRLDVWWDLIQVHVKTLSPVIHIDDDA